MRNTLLVAFGLVLLTMQAAVATLAPMHTFAPNLVLPIVICLGVSADVYIVRGAAIAFVLGYLLDAFCGNPMGVQTFVMVASFMVARGAAFRLLPHGPLFSALLTFGMGVISGFAVLALRAIFEKQAEMLTAAPGRTFAILAQSGAVTALFAPAIFATVRRIDGRALQKGDERASMAAS
ncbi:MAG TPA: rod shape-determining protein MreD [Polyangiales bacterium]|jgi:rod shape-determining protein MreD|nr:rod shape-determining protein MreD [Polyangiales bacterium]